MAGKHRKEDKHPKAAAIVRVAGHHMTHIVTLVSLHAGAIALLQHGGAFVGLAH